MNRCKIPVLEVLGGNMLGGAYRFELDIAPFASKETFRAPTSRMVDVTKSYMRLYEINKDPSTEDAVKFMKEHEDWVQEAVDLYHALSVENDAPKE